MAEPGFWTDQQTAQGVVQQVKSLKGWVEPFDKLSARVTSASELEEMLASDPDDDLSRELDTEVAANSKSRATRHLVLRLWERIMPANIYACDQYV